MSFVPQSSRTRRRTRLFTRAALAVVASLAVASLAGCRGGDSAPGEALPTAEFLFAAGDSTYWVRSGGEGMRVRSAPILLTQVDGGLYEIFLSDDGAEYPDASFATVRLWARSLQRRDSVRLFGDTSVMAALTRWQRSHPREAEIDPNDEFVTDDPATIVQDELEILDVHGPYLTFEHLLNMDIDGGPPHRHEGRRFVVDVRTGRVQSLVDLIGQPEATRVSTAARASLAHLTDSIRTAASAGDERAAAAVETLDSFRFDSTSFGLTDVARVPAIAFMIPGRGVDGEALALHLPAITVAEPSWWPPVRATLPVWAADSTRVRWDRPAYDVVARTSAEGDALALLLVAKAATPTPREWPVATVEAPAYQLISLESPPLDSAARSALARAFDLSTALDGLVQRASRRTPPPAPVRTHLRTARFDRTTRAHPARASRHRIP
ncbi:MAG: hypothetical protein LCH84_04350 [Gemmatimonadetes bacterium]|nr:hypothetical protein [Gemmatimonadota bacterium]